MGWKVVVGAALTACALVFLGSAAADGPSGPTSAAKQLGLITQNAHGSTGRAAPSVAAKSPTGFAIDPNLQLTYHGGPVMHTQNIHLIFWLPSGFQYGATAGDSTQYETDIENFVQDVAADDGKTSNAYGAVPQYRDSSGPGAYNVHYSDAVI